MKIYGGDQNRGVFLEFTNRDGEEYNLSHPVAYIQGFILASPYVTVGDKSIITCPKKGLVNVIEYKEERFLGKAKYAIEGKIYKHDFENPESHFYDKSGNLHIPKLSDKDLLATITGSWRGEIFIKKKDEKESQLLLDIQSLEAFEKLVKPFGKQHPMESRKVWFGVTDSLKHKKFKEATQAKRDLEDNQRRLALDRKKRGEEYQSEYFEFHDSPGSNEKQIGKPYLKQSASSKLVIA